MIQNRQTMENAISYALSVAAGDHHEDATLYRGSSILSELQSLAWAEEAKDLVPGYWSPSRDKALRVFWKQPGAGHLASAMYNAQAKLLGIPFRIVPRDPSIVSHVEQAEKIQQRLSVVSEFGQGFLAAMSKWYEDYLSQDNGAFMEVLGNGKHDMSIEGAPIAIRHLDSSKCIRTGDPVYPVVYRDTNGKDKTDYKLHFSRVIYASQMPSATEELHGVGYCAVSRAIDVAQTLIDMNVYKREKLGSRPHSRLYVGKGISANDIMSAFRMADTAMDQSGYKRYSRNVAIGSEDNSDIDIDAIDLTSMDQFDEGQSVPLAMNAIALAFGLNVNELWPSSSGGEGSKKTGVRVRGKLPDQVTSTLEGEFNFKFLPPYLKMVFDFQDDDEDQQRAVIRDIRARSRERNMYGGTTKPQTERRVMLKDGDIDRNEFAEMELLDGRLEDGTPIESLFYSTDEFYTGPNGVLNLGMQDLFIVSKNNAADILTAIGYARQRCYVALSLSAGNNTITKSKKALAALDRLEKLYIVPEQPASESVKSPAMELEDIKRAEEEAELNTEDEGIAEPDAEEQEPEVGGMGPRFRQRTNDREGGKDTATKEH